MPAKPRIADLAGSNATIQNSPPLVTSNKAREKYGLPLVTGSDGAPLRFDVLRAQRLAAPVTVYVEQFSAHPLERDAAELYGPPDGYLDVSGTFHKERRSADDTPVYEMTLRPEDGVYPLPYMARQADGRPWEEDCAHPMAPEQQARQPFYPDGSRLFEEIDRLGVGDKGIGNLVSARADVDFYRVVPSSGYTKGLAAKLRTDVGEGDIAAEVRGRDFFPYRPYHLGPAPPRPALARIANAVQHVLATGKYAGAIWTQGSPRIEETVYWLNLLVDTTLPVCGNASQRPHGQLSNDGDKNIVDSVEYIVSRVWADEAGRCRLGRTRGPQLPARDAAHVSVRREPHAPARRGHGATRERRDPRGHQGSARGAPGVGDPEGHDRQGRQLHDGRLRRRPLTRGRSARADRAQPRRAPAGRLRGRGSVALRPSHLGRSHTGHAARRVVRDARGAGRPRQRRGVRSPAARPVHRRPESHGDQGSTPPHGVLDEDRQRAGGRRSRPADGGRGRGGAEDDRGVSGGIQHALRASMASASVTTRRASSTWRFSMSRPSRRTTPRPWATASACAAMTRRAQSMSAGAGAKISLAFAIVLGWISVLPSKPRSAA